MNAATKTNYPNNTKIDATMLTKSQRWMRQVAGGLTVSLCLSLLATGKAVAASFAFTKIADTSSEFTNVSPGAAINDQGTVAFFATPSVGNQGIYTANNGAITEIVNTNALPSLLNANIPVSSVSFAPKLDINNNGTVAFLGQGVAPVGFNTGVFTSQNGSITTRSLAFLNGGIGSGVIVDFSLNDRSELAYLRQDSGRFSATDNLNISRPNQPDVRVVTATSSPGAQIGSFFGIRAVSNNQFAINNQGEVTFAARVVTNNTIPLQPQLRVGIFRGDGGAVTTLIDTLNTQSSPQLDVNDSGNVVLSNNDVLRLFNNNSGTLSAIADNSTAFNTFGNAAINNNNTVAFAASLDTGITGIFTGSNPDADKVIATGDSLLGSTVTDLIFARSGLNNLNQIAFYAQLADGTRGIFRAERFKSVPEPDSAIGILTFAVVGLGGWRQYRQRSHSLLTSSRR